MELRTFVATTLREVIDSIADVIPHARERGAEINPSTLEWRTDQGQIVIYDVESGLIASNIEFDVAVTATESKESGVEGGVKVLGLQVGVSGRTQSTGENQSVTRVKFTVPLVFPTSKPRKPKIKH